MQRHALRLWEIIPILLVVVTSTTSSSTLSPQLFEDDLEVGLSRVLLLPNALEYPRTALHNVHSQSVTVFNNHPNKTMILESVIAMPQHGHIHNDFHVPFVRDQSVPPQGNLTFVVIFLPTRIGAVSTDILIRTTFGQLKYHVQGVGVASPFKVVPLTHLVSYAGHNSDAVTIPDVALYNPFEAPLQITEIFSSGGKFFLELPNTENVSNKMEEEENEGEDGTITQTHLWTIAPYDKRAVIRVRFVGSRTAGNYSAYVRIKMRSMDEETVLVIPIHMEVRPLQAVTLYPERSLIDLGSVLLSDKRPLSINIYTSDTADIGLESLQWESYLAIGEATTRFRRDLDCTNIVVGEESLVRLKIECDLQWMEVIRNVSQSWEAFVPGAVMLVDGGVTVNSTFGLEKKSQLHRIPLFAELIPGAGIELPANVTVSFTSNDAVSIGIMYLRSNFENPIVITGIQLNGGACTRTKAHTVFAIVNEQLRIAEMEFPLLLRPGESWTMAPVVVAAAASLGNGTLPSFQATIQVTTNVTEVLTVPLFGYSGRLTRLTLNDGVRQLIGKLGRVGALKEKEMVVGEDAPSVDFGIIPLDVESHKYVALWNDNPVAVDLLRWHLPAMNVMEISITSVGCTNKYEFGYNKDSELQPDEWCVFSFSTKASQAGEYSATFLYETNVEVVEWPIKIVAHTSTLTIDQSSLVLRNCFPKSTCSVDINVESTHSETLILHELVTPKDAAVHLFTREILPNSITKVGLMFFTPRLNRVEPCYTNMYSNKVFENTNIDGLLVLQQTAISMFDLLKRRDFQLPFQLVTDTKKFSFTASVEFIWPKLIARRHGLKEHVVLAGQDYSYNITLYNPLDESIGYWYFLTDDRGMIMMLTGTPLSGGSEFLHKRIGARVFWTSGNKGADKFVLQPGEFRNITVHVRANEEPDSYASVFVLKNNFTFFEGSWQRVRIVQPQFKFGNRKPFSTTPLLFEVPDQPNACLQQNVRDVHSLVTTKRTFTAKNSGHFPIAIKGMSINAEPCSGYGFVIMNCGPFALAPNETHKIEISFMPDFTLSRVERRIEFHADIDFGIEYTLVGVVPHANLLERCGRTVDRPWWEAGLKKWALSMLATMAVIVATVAYFESLKILKDHLVATNRQRGPFQAPLDFKKLTATKAQTNVTTNSAPTATTAAGITKETAANKQPKKKGLSVMGSTSSSSNSSASTLFSSKRFSWFINRSQQLPQGASPVISSEQGTGNNSTAAAVPSSSSSSSAASNNGDKKLGKNSTKSSGEKSAAVVTSSTKSTSEKAVSNVIDPASSNKKSAKKEAAPTKKAKSKGKSGGQSATKSVEAEVKVESKESVQDIGELKSVLTKEAENLFTNPPPPLSSQQPTSVTQLAGFPTGGISSQSEEFLANLAKDPSLSSNGYGKTPGRERKEKQTTSTNTKRNPAPTRANKVSLFQGPSSTRNQPMPMDPWTSACRGLFQAQQQQQQQQQQQPSEMPSLPQSLNHLQEPRFEPRFNGQTMNNNHELAQNYAHLMHHRPGLNEEQVAEDLVNPLGAIGTIPPISKTYSLFDAPSSISMPTTSSSFSGSVINSNNNNNNLGYSNNFDFHGHLRSTPPLPPSLDYPGNQSHNTFGMNQSYGNATMNDMYSDDRYAQYQKRLALMAAMNKHQQEQQQQQQQAQNFIGPSDYSSWDLRQDYQSQLRAQALQNQLQQQQQQQQQQQREFYGLSGRPTGPPPGLGASGYTQNNHVQNGTNDTTDESALQYDPFRSIWNQWNNQSQ